MIESNFIYKIDIEIKMNWTGGAMEKNFCPKRVQLLKFDEAAIFGGIQMIVE